MSFPNLNAGTPYTFTVVATNAAGETTSDSRTFTGWAKPSPPTNVRITDEGDSRITIAWDPGSKTGGGAVTYTVHSGHRAPQPVASALTWTDVGLANGNDYTYWVTATNAGENESDNSPTVVANPYGLPSVSNLSGGDPGQTSITWSWAGNENGRNASYSWTLDRSGAGRVGSGSVEEASVTTPGLVPNTTYSFCVVPTNARGSGTRVCAEVATDPPPPVVFVTPGVVYYTLEPGKYQVQWFQPGTWCRIYDQGQLIWDFACGGTAVYPHSYTGFTTPTLSPGSHTWTLEVDGQTSGPVSVTVPG